MGGVPFSVPSVVRTTRLLCNQPEGPHTESHARSSAKSAVAFLHSFLRVLGASVVNKIHSTPPGVPSFSPRFGLPPSTPGKGYFHFPNPPNSLALLTTAAL